MTCSEEILRILSKTDKYLANHELRDIIKNSNESAVSARTRPLCKKGLIEGRTREGKRYKEWQITEAGRFFIRNKPVKSVVYAIPGEQLLML